LSEEEIDELINNTRELMKSNLEPDSPEDLASIPMVELSDIEPEAEALPLVEQEVSGVKVLHHPLFTNGIAYLNLWFDSSAVPEELIPYAGLLVSILGKSAPKTSL
jgi:Zn-dependent M16 (insulinase) family peptidase